MNIDVKLTQIKKDKKAVVEVGTQSPARLTLIAANA